MKAKAATTVEKQCGFVNVTTGLRCPREALAKGHCWTHYQQARRGRPLTPIRPRDLVLLPGSIRVTKPVAEHLYGRISAKKARSIYEVTRQAVEAGVAAWERQEVKLAKAKAK